MADAPELPPRINFDYLKSHFFHTIHVDGAIGGPTPSGLLHVALYSERTAIPQRIVQQVNSDGSLGDAIPEMTVSRGGVVRELEADLILTPDAAENIAKWLLEHAQKVRDHTRRE